MGRKLMRVPLDFSWPCNKVWGGYLNPHNAPCPMDGVTCFNGSTAEALWLDSISRFLAIVAEEAADAPFAEDFKARGRTYPHPYLEEFAQAPRVQMPREVINQIRDIKDQNTRNRALASAAQAYPSKLLPLTAGLQHLIEGLAGEKCRGSLSSGISWALRKRLKEFAGITDENWGVCLVCEGHGRSPAVQEAHDAWKSSEPPTGDGYQLWENTSEGSPISPVFTTLEKLCAWAADNATVFGSDKVSAERWRAMLDADFVSHEVQLENGNKLVFI